MEREGKEGKKKKREEEEKQRGKKECKDAVETKETFTLQKCSFVKKELKCPRPFFLK